MRHLFTSASGRPRSWVAAAAGVLAANALPHLASAAAGKHHLTPLAGRDSSPGVNAAWSALNLAGSVLLLRVGAAADPEDQWDSRLLAFGSGAAAWSAWLVGSEAVLRVNTPR